MRVPTWTADAVAADAQAFTGTAVTARTARGILARLHAVLTAAVRAHPPRWMRTAALGADRQQPAAPMAVEALALLAMATGAHRRIDLGFEAMAREEARRVHVRSLRSIEGERGG